MMTAQQKQIERMMAEISTPDPRPEYQNNCEMCGAVCPFEFAKCMDCEAAEDFPEPDIDDSINFCPNCERPQQFSGMCGECEREFPELEY